MDRAVARSFQEEGKVVCPVPPHGQRRKERGEDRWRRGRWTAEEHARLRCHSPCMGNQSINPDGEHRGTFLKLLHALHTDRRSLDLQLACQSRR